MMASAGGVFDSTLPSSTRTYTPRCLVPPLPPPYQYRWTRDSHCHRGLFLEPLSSRTEGSTVPPHPPPCLSVSLEGPVLFLPREKPPCSCSSNLRCGPSSLQCLQARIINIIRHEHSSMLDAILLLQDTVAPLLCAPSHSPSGSELCINLLPVVLDQAPNSGPPGCGAENRPEMHLQLVGTEFLTHCNSAALHGRGQLDGVSAIFHVVTMQRDFLDAKRHASVCSPSPESASTERTHVWVTIHQNSSAEGWLVASISYIAAQNYKPARGATSICSPEREGWWSSVSHCPCHFKRVDMSSFAPNFGFLLP